MQIQQSHEHGIRTLQIHGDFDTTDVEAFLAHIGEAVEGECSRVLVDAEHLRFINSTALGSLIRAQKSLKEFGGDISVCALSGFAFKVFRSLGMDHKIQCFATVAEGVEYLQRVGEECVAVPGDEEIGFLFTDDEQLSVAGDDPRMGTIKSISDHSVNFRWQNNEGLDVATLLAPGVLLHMRFKLQLFHPSHVFDAHAAVERTEVGADNWVDVSARFVVLTDAERNGLQRFARDMRLLAED